MSKLLLDSLEIKNFRAFEHLRIEKLDRVNLIVGKNNVGKNNVLKALRVYAQRGDPSLIWELIEERDESSISRRTSSVRIDEKTLLYLRHIFYGRSDISTGSRILNSDASSSPWHIASIFRCLPRHIALIASGHSSTRPMKIQMRQAS